MCGSGTRFSMSLWRRSGGQGPFTKENWRPRCCSIGLILLSTASRTLPTNLPEGLILGFVSPKTGRSGDALVVHASISDKTLAHTPEACGGQQLLRRLGPTPSLSHLVVQDVRGNVITRWRNSICGQLRTA